MKLFDSFRTRSFRAGGYSVAAALIVLALLVVVNLIVGALPASKTKLDATSNNLLSISQQTRNVLNALDEDVTLHWICQEGYEDVQVETLLEHYAAASSHIKLEKKDPDVNPGLVEQYTEEYYNNSVLVQCGDRFQYVDYNNGIYVKDMETYYATAEEVWTFSAEDALTRSIYNVATDNLPKAYAVTGHGEVSLSSSLREGFANENIELEDLDLISKTSIPEDADMLLINMPLKDISESEKQVLEKYMAGGGKLLLVTLARGGDMPNLEALMLDYGIAAVEGMVMESVQSGYSGWPYYLLPKLNNHAITKPLMDNNMYVLLPESHGLKVVQGASDTLTVSELLTTSNKSYSKTAEVWDSLDQEEGDIQGPFAVAVAAEDVQTGAQCVWFSSPYVFAADGGNQDLFYNAVNWMCGQEEMIAIRGKDVTPTHLNMDAESVETMSWLVIAIIPIGFLALGLFTYLRRKRR